MAPVLSAADHAFFEANGYLVVRAAVPAGQCAATVDALFDFLGMDPHDPSDWARPPLTGTVPMETHPTVWANRLAPRLYRAFAELYGTEALVVSRDRILFKQPAGEERTSSPRQGCACEEKSRETAARRTEEAARRWRRRPMLQLGLPRVRHSRQAEDESRRR